MSAEGCNGVAWVVESVSTSERKTAGHLTDKTNWVKRCPWLFSEALTVEGAKECKRQLLAIEDGKCEPRLKEWRENFMDDLTAAPHLAHNILSIMQKKIASA